MLRSLLMFPLLLILVLAGGVAEPDLEESDS